MKNVSSPSGPIPVMRSLWARHQLLVVLLILLSVVAGTSRYLLRADLAGMIALFGPDIAANPPEEFRVCSSTGTVFQHLETVKEVRDLFQKRASDVVGEREQYLIAPSKWTCPPSGEEPVTELESLAQDLPGWHERETDNTLSLRPVTFASFESVLGEFEFEYECKLGEFSRRATSMVNANLDLDDPKQYCCSNSDTCVQATSGVNCTYGPVESSVCLWTDPADNTQKPKCPTGNTQADLATRFPALLGRIDAEKQRGRIAMDETVHALKSLEKNYIYAKQLTCFQRALLDLKNEMSLLADTTSCMPKIWDAVTSIHDRRYPPSSSSSSGL